MNTVISQEEMDIINAQERAKQERKDAMELCNYQGMSEEEIAEELRLENERWEAQEAEYRAEYAWQEWMGDPLYLSHEERKLHEIALDHEAIEMTLMGL